MPKADKLLLIEQASFSLSFLDSVFLTDSEPAKSTKKIYEFFYIVFFNAYFLYTSSNIIIVCALELVAFISVAPNDLFSLPYSIKSVISL